MMLNSNIMYKTDIDFFQNPKLTSSNTKLVASKYGSIDLMWAAFTIHAGTTLSAHQNAFAFHQLILPKMCLIWTLRLSILKGVFI